VCNGSGENGSLLAMQRHFGTMPSARVPQNWRLVSTLHILHYTAAAPLDCVRTAPDSARALRPMLRRS
jgi:hypothetical protein